MKYLQFLCTCAWVFLFAGCSLQKEADFIDVQDNETLPETVSYGEDEKNWRSVYLDVLHEYQEQNRNSANASFSLYDISGDDVPELVICGDQYRVYSYQDELLDLGEQWKRYQNVYYYPDTSTISVYSAGIGTTHRTCYQLINGSISETVCFSTVMKSSDENSDIECYTEYSVNDEVVTEREYQNAYDSVITEHYQCLGRDFALQDVFIEEALTEGTDWQQVYRNVLYGCIEQVQATDSVRFSFCDVTNDGIPELFLGYGAELSPNCYVLGVQNGLISLGKHGCYGTVNYHPEKKLFYCHDIHQGYETGMYYTMDENGVRRDVLHFYNNMGAAENREACEYKLNGMSVSEETYHETLSDYQTDDWNCLGWEYALNTSDIEAALAEFE